MNPHRPPRVATAILSFFIPADEREFQLGDLAERYDYLRRTHPAKAGWWYWGQAAHAMGRFVTARDRKPRVRGRMHEQGTGSALLHDLRYALRSLRRTPAFTTVAILTLAIGIGANTAIFSVVDAVVLRPLPFRDADRLMRVYLLMPNPSGGEPVDMTWSYPKYQTLRDVQNIFEDLSLFWRRDATLTEAGEAERISGEVVGPSYFGLLGQDAFMGRTFLPEEGAGGSAQPTALLSHQLWRRRFAGDPAVVGRSVRLNGVSYPIAGVTAPGFRGLSGAAEFFLPTSIFSSGQIQNPGGHFMSAIARLRPGVTPDQAKEAMGIFGQRIEEAYPSSRAEPWGARARTLEEVRVEPAIRTSVLLLLGAVGFVLLIACVNLANLLLGRATARQREFAIRLSIGANRPRIVRQLLTESMMLALLGGGVGLALAAPAVGFLRRMAPQASRAFTEDVSGLTQMGMESIGININALLFTIGMTLVTGIVFGLVPALQASRPNLTQALKEGGGVAPAGHSLRLGTRELLVIAEFALAFVLIVGSGLMIKSFGHLQSTDIGFDPENVLTVAIGLPSADYDRAAAQRLMNQLRDRIRTIPGVETVGYNICTPLSTGCNGTGITLRDRPESDADLGVEIHFVSAEYFETLRIPVAQGRAFTPRDREGARRVAIVSESAARQFWPGESPIGKLVSLGQGGLENREIVGVVNDVRYNAVEEAAYPAAYIPVNQSTRRSGFILIRTAVEPLTLLPSIRQLVRGFDPNLPLSDIETMEDRLGSATSGARFSAILLSTYSAIALVLAAIGIYGVMSYAVAHRTREIGLRLAMGAERTAILRLIVGRALAVALVGLSVGLLSAWGLMRVLASLLYEVQPYDPTTFAIVGLGLAGLAFVASYLPARRASLVDPMVALREQ